MSCIPVSLQSQGECLLHVCVVCLCACFMLAVSLFLGMCVSVMYGSCIASVPGQGVYHQDRTGLFVNSTVVCYKECHRLSSHKILS